MTAPAPTDPDFLWGAATSAYQIEGSPLADGSGPSIWHRFSRLPGRTIDAATGDVACDHYHRYPEDLGLMRDLGVNAYRFSISWGRLLPEGRGAVNRKGIGFYDRLIDAILEHGITPFATLYHWDLPLALEDHGGWLNDDIADWYGEFADTALRAYGDRVPYWVTVNEPAVIMEKGYVLGTYAPGHRNAAEAPVVARNLLRAHGTGVLACRASRAGQIGIAVNLQPKHPASDHPGDVAAARRADAFRNRQFLDAILLGRSPPELADMFGEQWRALSSADLRLIHQPIDFVGLNYYTRNVVRADATFLPTGAQPVEQDAQVSTLMGWEVYPQGMAEVLHWVRDRFGDLAIYVTENGAALHDPAPGPDGIVHDPTRVAFLRDHIRAALEARVAGVNLKGYFVWSLLDNFEWNSGYLRPFGLVHVDFASQRRTRKESFAFYADVIRSGGRVVLTG